MSLSKRVRFEVFKRDKFTCQYCGKSAPDVVLHADHIHPKSKGGDDTLLNLATACAGCNMGKAAVPLDDDTAVAKQRRQLEELEERREQLTMLVEWQRSLASFESDELVEVANFWCDLADWHGLNDHGNQQLRGFIRKFGVAETLEAMRIAAETYFRTDNNGTLTDDSANHAFNKVGGICHVRGVDRKDPARGAVFGIRGILVKSVGYINDPFLWSTVPALVAADGKETWISVAAHSRSWTAFRNEAERRWNELSGGSDG